MGVEPTGNAAETPPDGFEDRTKHRLRNASLSAQHSTGLRCVSRKTRIVRPPSCSISHSWLLLRSRPQAGYQPAHLLNALSFAHMNPVNLLYRPLDYPATAINGSQTSNVASSLCSFSMWTSPSCALATHCTIDNSSPLPPANLWLENPRWRTLDCGCAPGLHGKNRSNRWARCSASMPGPAPATLTQAQRSPSRSEPASALWCSPEHQHAAYPGNSTVYSLAGNGDCDAGGLACHARAPTGSLALQVSCTGKREPIVASVGAFVRL